MEKVLKLGLIASLVFVLGFAFEASMMLPAVSETGQGMMIKLSAKTIPGTGKTLVATEPLVGFDTQQSEKTAVELAKRYLGLDELDKDIVFVFQTDSSTIDGGSAGTAMTLLAMAVLTEQQPAEGITVTGAIGSNGDIKHVGGVLQKARAAAAEHMVFLIPAGQEEQLIYSNHYYSPKSGLYIEEIVPVRINITEYAKENWGLEVQQISSVEQAAEMIFTELNLTRPSSQTPKLPKFESDLTRLDQLADSMLARAERAVGASNSSIAKNYLDLAISVESGHSYSRANYAFLALVATDSSSYSDFIANKLAGQLSSMSSSDPIWRGEAELRLIWALFSETEAKNARAEWLMISAQMVTDELIGDDGISPNKASELADQAIIDAKEILELYKAAGADVTEAEKNLDFAIKGYEVGLYFGSLMSALDSNAWARAAGEAIYPGQAINIVVNQTSWNSTGWTEAYRRHSLYLLDQANSDPALFEPAVFSAYRAVFHRDAFIDQGFLPIDFEFPEIQWVWLVVLVLSAYIWKTRKPKTQLNQTEMMHLVEAKTGAIKHLEKLRQDGEISQKSFTSLMEELK
ncbi:MAG: hypothetical protein GOU99_00195 [Candidatus Altiarchaeota archaeon]|nr:hypothetical protein [Candidatus Altiarchaeota archaeon]